jgi:rod shape-determining protein MreB and related proteins
MNTLTELRKLVAPPDLAIDLGTANTRLFTQRHGLLADEPTLVHQANGAIAAVGLSAARVHYAASTDNSHSILQGAHVTDTHAAGVLIRTLLLERAPGVWTLGSRFVRALVCVPSHASATETDSLLTAAREAGIAAATPVSKGLAAAIGAGLDVSSPYAQLLVDIGASATELAVVRSGALLQVRHLPLATGSLRRALQQSLAAQTGINPLAREAELLTQAIGLTGYEAEERVFVTRGVQVSTRQPMGFSVSSYDAAEALLPVGQELVQSIHQAIQHLDPELSCQAIETGITLTGGGALLPGLATRLRQLTGYAINVAPDPARATIRGAGQMLQVSAATGLWGRGH